MQNKAALIHHPKERRKFLKREFLRKQSKAAFKLPSPPSKGRRIFFVWQNSIRRTLEIFHLTRRLSNLRRVAY